MAKKKQGSSFRKQATVAGGVLVLLLAAHGSKGHGGGILAELDSIGGAGQYTPASWARTLLRADGLPRTPCNVGAVTAWERAEGGHWANAARFNPLDTTQTEPGSQPMNSVGVQAYTSWRQGLRATVTTLNNGNYGAVLSALQSGDNAQAVAGAVGSSPWGTGGFQANC